MNEMGYDCFYQSLKPGKFCWSLPKIKLCAKIWRVGGYVLFQVTNLPTKNRPTKRPVRAPGWYALDVGAVLATWLIRQFLANFKQKFRQSMSAHKPFPFTGIPWMISFGGNASFTSIQIRYDFTTWWSIDAIHPCSIKFLMQRGYGSVQICSAGIAMV